MVILAFLERHVDRCYVVYTTIDADGRERHPVSKRFGDEHEARAYVAEVAQGAPIEWHEYE